MGLPDDVTDLFRYGFVPTNSLDRLNAPALRIVLAGGNSTLSPRASRRLDTVPDGLEYGMVQTDATRRDGAPALRVIVVGGGI